MLYCLYRKNTYQKKCSHYILDTQFSKDVSPSHTSPVMNQRTQRTALSMIKLLQNDTKQRYRDWTLPSNPQLVKHTSTFEHKNIQYFSKRKRMRHNYAHPACQCNKDRGSHKMETASHTFLLGQTFQVQLLSPCSVQGPTGDNRGHLRNFSLNLCCVTHSPLELTYELHHQNLVTTTFMSSVLFV